MHLAIPLLKQPNNVWFGIILGLMEATAPKDVAEDWDALVESRGHFRSGSIVILEGEKKGSSKHAGRRRRDVEFTAGRIVAAFKYKGEG